MRLNYLPFLIFQKVVRVMDLLELFELSQTSESMYFRIKFIKRKILPIKVCISDTQYLIAITDYEENGDSKHFFKLNFTLIFPRRWKWPVRQLKLNGSVFNVNQKHNHKERPGFIIPYDNQLFHLLDHLFDLFCCSEFILVIQNSEATAELLSNPIFRKCTYVNLYSRGNRIVTQQEVSTILDYIKPTFGFALSGPVNAEFYNRSLLNCSYFYARDAKWVKLEDLFSMDGGTVVLDEHNLTPADIEKFIVHWQKGNCKKLKRLRICKLPVQTNWVQLFENIKLKKWDPTKRDRYYRRHLIYEIWEVDLKDGYDIESVDGTMGTILKDSEDFLFYVWHDRFPSSIGK